MVYDVVKWVYMLCEFDNYENVNDDSFLGGYEDWFNIYYIGSYMNEEDEVYLLEGVC